MKDTEVTLRDRKKFLEINRNYRLPKPKCEAEAPVT